MSPILSVNNERNQALRNSVLSGYRGLRTSICDSFSDDYNRIFIKFYLTATATFRNSVRLSSGPMSITCRNPIFRLSIVKIVLLGASKQVITVYTSGVIAMVKNWSRRPLIVGKKEPETASSKGSWLITGGEPSIAPQVHRPNPLPASSFWAIAGRLVNKTPKSLNLSIRQVGWCKIDLNHIVKLILSDLVGLRGVKRVPQAAIIT